MKFFLIDGHALFYRAYFAFIKNPLIDSKGVNVSAVFGFTNSLFKLIREQSPDLMAVAFDHREPTFRHSMYKEYKANREAMPDELIIQIPKMYEAVNALGLKSVTMPGYEADDIIGTLCTKASEAGLDCYIVTGDKDLFQLMGDKVRIFNIRSISKPEEKQILDPEYVKEKYGIPYTSIIDYLSLTGDSSDNIPGVEGVGDKTASKLLKQYKSLDALYERIDQVKPEAIRKKLVNGRESAYLSRSLLKIKTDMDIDFHPDDFVCAGILPEGLGDWLERNEFRSLKKYLPAPAQKPGLLLPAAACTQWKRIETPSDFRAYICGISRDNPLIIHPRTGDGEDSLILVNHSGEPGVLPLDLLAGSPEYKKNFEDFLAASGGLCAGHDVKNLLHLLSSKGITITCAFFDTSLAGFLLNSENKNPSIKILCGIAEIDDSGITDDGSLQADLAKAVMLRKIHPLLYKKLVMEGMKDLMEQIEIPVIYVLFRMEEAGVLINGKSLGHYKAEIHAEIEELRKSITGMAGAEFNLNSPRQLGEVLFEKMEIHKIFGVQKVKKTLTGYSTSSETLEKYSSHPVVNSILRYRMLEKLRSTYIDSLINIADKGSGRIHAQFNQMNTVTGRLSSNNPNLQNIPVRNAEGARIREAFIAPEGSVLVSADYSQIELRIMAHLSGDALMCEAFEKKRDIHAETAARIFNVSLDEVTPEARSRAKAVNFGVIYGMGPFKLSRDTGMNMQEAKDFIGNYFSVYSGVRKYIDSQIIKVRETGMTRNLFGRIRRLQGINSSRKDEQILAEHMAVNTPVQGSAADLIKMAMIRIQKRIESGGLKTRLIIQVHDELLFETPLEELEHVKQMVREEMENAAILMVPLEVKTGSGLNWLEAH